MIYTKTLKDGRVVRSAVTKKNTYTRCANCGREIPVSLRDPALKAVEDPFTSEMFCPDCTREMLGRRPLVYICSPYSGDVEANVAAARRYCRMAVERGYIPIAPHLLYPQFLNDVDPAERMLGLSFGNVLMDKCSELWVCGDHLSPGMEAEFDRASASGMTIRFLRGDEEENSDA